MKRKPTTYTTVECMVRDIRRGSQDSGVRFLARVIRAVRRERGDEVRRLRRALRDVRRTVTFSTSMMAEECRTIVGAALARRRRKPR